MQGSPDVKMEDKINELSEKFKELKTKALHKGMTEKEVALLFLKQVKSQSSTTKRRKWKVVVFLALVLPLFLASLGYYFFDELFDKSSPCTVDNSIFVMEAARPIADCKMCQGLTEVPKLSGLSVETFANDFAFTAKPLVVKDATQNWTAVQLFTYEYFRKLYIESATALNVTEEECQFFPYKTEFHSLKELFNMSKERSEFKAEPWYVGWSNCDSNVRDELRKHYSKPYFIPYDSEHSETDWIFMGGVGPGANVHLDSVERPSWQAQLSGRKTWHLVPPPECEAVCQSLDVTIEKGETVLIDTNQWYHSTTVEPGEISITIGSEYD